jgi:hypothetical protein
LIAGNGKIKVGGAQQFVGPFGMREDRLREKTAVLENSSQVTLTGRDRG